MEKWDIYNENGVNTGKVICRGDKMEKGEYHILVLGVIKNKRGQLLSTKRSLNIKFPGMWEFPGGAAKHGETIIEAVKREIFEEIGVEVSEKELKCKIHGKCDDDKYPYLYFVYAIEKNVDIQQIKLQLEETIEASYKTIDEIEILIKEGKFLSGIFKEINLLKQLGD